MGKIREKLYDERLIGATFYRLLPYQVLMIAINAVNSIVDSLYAGNAIGESGMGAMGLFAPISLSFAAYVQVMEKRLASLVLPVTDGAVGVVLFSFLLIPAMGMNGLYVANILNGVFCAAVITALAWLEKKRFPRSVEDLMAVPDSFGVGEDRRMDITVRSMEQVVRIAEQVQRFCLQKNIDARRAYYTGLCTEEMAGNIVTHGFAIDRKKHSVDIRLTCKEEEIVLRMRDDCAAFNPSQYARILDSGNREERFKDFGICMVYSLAREVNYQNLLDQNVLTIHI